MRRCLFIGAFSIPESDKFQGSAAGAKVQMEIIDGLRDHVESLSAAVMPEIPSWPKGPLWSRSQSRGVTRFFPIVNIFIVKRIFFFLLLMKVFFEDRPTVIVQYNASIPGMLFSLVARLLSSRSVLVLQDVHAPSSFVWRDALNPVKLVWMIYAKLLRVSFDYYIPITSACVKDFSLNSERCLVFPGGVLKDYLEAARVQRAVDKEFYAVFAGALQEYNGIDLLARRWPKPEVLNCKLHIFGRGALEQEITRICEKNSNLIFHGHKEPALIDSYTSNAKFNFCLRYSRGINQQYFFPSKFFDLISMSGRLICNKFDNIPHGLERYITFIGDDLEELVGILTDGEDLSEVEYFRKIEKLEACFTWSSCFSKFFDRFEMRV